MAPARLATNITNRLSPVVSSRADRTDHHAGQHPIVGVWKPAPNAISDQPCLSGPSIAEQVERRNWPIAELCRRGGRSNRSVVSSGGRAPGCVFASRTRPPVAPSDRVAGLTVCLLPAAKVPGNEGRQSVENGPVHFAAQSGDCAHCRLRVPAVVALSAATAPSGGAGAGLRGFVGRLPAAVLHAAGRPAGVQARLGHLLCRRGVLRRRRRAGEPRQEGALCGDERSQRRRHRCVLLVHVRRARPDRPDLRA